MKRFYGWLVVLAAMTAGCSKSDSGKGSSGASGTSAATGATAAAPAAGGAAPAPATPAAVSPDAYVNDVLHSFASGDATKLWDALPAKYQSDVKSIVAEFAGKVDADLWNKGFALLGKTAKVLKEKKQYVLGSQIAGAFAPPDAKEAVSKNWDSIVGMLETVATSDIKTIDGLKSVDIGKFVSTTGNALLSGGMKAAEAANPQAKAELERVRKAEVKLVKTEGDTATLSMVDESGAPKEKVFKKVDGKWLPAEMVAAWDKGVADIKTDMASVAIPPEQKAQAMGGIAMVESTIDQLAAAKDQAEFDKVLAGIFTMFAPMMGPGGAAPGGPAPGAPGLVPPTLPGAPALPGGGPALTPPSAPPTVPPPPAPK